MCVYKIKRSEQYGYGVTNKGVSLKFAEVHPSVNRHGIAVWLLYTEADLGLLQHPRWSSLWWYLTASIITNSSTLDVAAVLDPPLL